MDPRRRRGAGALRRTLHVALLAAAVLIAAATVFALSAYLTLLHISSAR